VLVSVQRQRGRILRLRFTHSGKTLADKFLVDVAHELFNLLEFADVLLRCSPPSLLEILYMSGTGPAIGHTMRSNPKVIHFPPFALTISFSPLCVFLFFWQVDNSDVGTFANSLSDNTPDSRVSTGLVISAFLPLSLPTPVTGVLHKASLVLEFGALRGRFQGFPSPLYGIRYRGVYGVRRG
jgi:hypothetical protein